MGLAILIWFRFEAGWVSQAHLNHEMMNCQWWHAITGILLCERSKTANYVTQYPARQREANWEAMDEWPVRQAGQQGPIDGRPSTVTRTVLATDSRAQHQCHGWSFIKLRRPNSEYLMTNWSVKHCKINTCRESIDQASERQQSREPSIWTVRCTGDKMFKLITHRRD